MVSWACTLPRSTQINKCNEGDQANEEECCSSSLRALGSPWGWGLQATLVNAEMVKKKEKEKENQRKKGSPVCVYLCTPL
jgi:hypothetical protein